MCVSERHTSPVVSVHGVVIDAEEDTYLASCKRVVEMTTQTKARGHVDSLEPRVASHTMCETTGECLSAASHLSRLGVCMNFWPYATLS